MKYNFIAYKFEFLSKGFWKPVESYSMSLGANEVFLKVFLRKMERNSERVDGSDSTSLFASKPNQAAAAAL